MGFSRPAIVLAILLFVSLCCAPASATKKIYIVYLGSHSHGREATADIHARVVHSHHNFLASFIGSYEKAKEAMIYSYKRHINGFAAIMNDKEAAEIAKHPDVISVFVDKPRKLHTTHSWDFTLVEKNGVIHHDSIWRKANFGEDIIIASIDTGIWPESKSFSDEGYGPVPSRWKGSCDNDTASGVQCNRKIIGAKYFAKAYESYLGPVDPSIRSARDFDGHGSHTLSTAAGNFVPGANYLGTVNGTAKGGAPRARVAAYKVCWPPTLFIGGCFDADILEAMDTAIHDGVDVLSLSLGGSFSDYFSDPLSIAAFHAVKEGITVVCSAGNDGQMPGTVTNVSPWIFTVAASTTDRGSLFNNFLEVRTDAGRGMRFQGTSISGPLPENKFYPMITGDHARASSASPTDAMLCKNDTLDHEKVRGKILVCLRGETERADKSHQAQLAGAVGMVLINDALNGDVIYSDPHFVPSIHIDYNNSTALWSYMNSTKETTYGFITAPKPQFDHVKPAPMMASFSSMGPSSVTPEILKPDITAPGNNILAAFSGAVPPTSQTYDHRQTPYNVLSGTSMSCPHVSGVVGLVKAVHRDWSPAAIKSAIMTTARTRDSTGKAMLAGYNLTATPFNYGSGHIRPNRAVDPGLVYDLNTKDYLNFLCASGYNSTMLENFGEGYRCSRSASILDLNYPAVVVRGLCNSFTATRRLKNVGKPGTYRASIHQPRFSRVSVEPNVLAFERVGEEKEFKITIQAAERRPKSPHAESKYYSGGLTWSDGKHYVRSPISVAFAMQY